LSATSVPEIRILGVRVHALTVDQLHENIAGLVDRQAHALVLNVNVYAINLTFGRPWLRELFNRAEIVFSDGAGIRLGARLLGYRLPRRITYADWIWQLAEFAAERGFALFFLGACSGVAEEAAARLQGRFPALRIVGVHHGYFDKSPGSADNESVIQKINATQPNILIVGFGMPLQERWLLENWGHIEANVALTGGAVFDYTSGHLRRAPRCLTDSGLEWLGRLIIEPRRLWKRYLIGNPLFLWRVLRQRLGLLRFD
jgi:N-acetylglucosaminyldiphosphoundecaprenol N-acetyl-beta-D-mannosaminyltransferase